MAQSTIKKNLLDGITSTEVARETLFAVRTNVTDDSIRVNKNTNGNVTVYHYTDDNNAEQICGSATSGVSYQTKENGTWTTTPQSIGWGGTGATTAVDARTNLGLGTIFKTSSASATITTAATTTQSDITVTLPSVSGYTPYAIQGWNLTGTASSMLMISRLQLNTSTRVVNVQVRNTSSSAANATLTIYAVYVKTVLLSG